LFAFAKRFFEDVRVLLDLAYSDHVFLGFDFLSFYGKYFFFFILWSVWTLKGEKLQEHGGVVIGCSLFGVAAVSVVLSLRTSGLLWVWAC
jgi:hypothetical protein